MSFLRVKRRRKFNVELSVLSLSDVPLINAVIFAKVRLLECGSFEGFTWHRPVVSYKVDFTERDQDLTAEKCLSNTDNPVGSEQSASENNEPNLVDEHSQPFQFQCRIPTDEKTGELEQCRCKISLRKEDRGGRSPQKLGFVVLNLSEFAAWGNIGLHKSILLEGYSGQRQDNSRVNVFVKMTHQGQDPLFKVPNSIVSTALDDAQLNPADRKAPSAHLMPGVYNGTSGDKKNAFPDDSVALSTRNTCDTPNKKLSENHFLSHQPNPNYHLHYYENRPISCTHFPSTSGTIRDYDPTELRASWHGGASNGHSTAQGSLNVGTPRHEFNSLGRGSAKASLTCGKMDSGLGAGLAPSRHSESSGVHTLLHLSTSPALKNTLGGGSVADRIQKTRRDASGVIDEVLAETSALLDSHSNTSTALSWEGLGGGESGCDDSYANNDMVNFAVSDNRLHDGNPRPNFEFDDTEKKTDKYQLKLACLTDDRILSQAESATDCCRCDKPLTSSRYNSIVGSAYSAINDVANERKDSK